MEHGFDVAPIETHVRTQTGRYLDAWYKRLRDAYVETMADLGSPPTSGIRSSWTRWRGANSSTRRWRCWRPRSRRPRRAASLRQVAADGLVRMHFRANDTRARGLGVEFTDVVRLDIEM
ncbi:hypothetical protein ACGFYP_04065 [Streptomyces sp. NPDC048370]|uniref:hypothetical protein n=1 Tax=Streptomyces sp. NPDC048370 TaxID=3365540 RepID=UPI003722EE33